MHAANIRVRCAQVCKSVSLCYAVLQAHAQTNCDCNCNYVTLLNNGVF